MEAWEWGPEEKWWKLHIAPEGSLTRHKDKPRINWCWLRFVCTTTQTPIFHDEFPSPSCPNTARVKCGGFGGDEQLCAAGGGAAAQSPLWGRDARMNQGEDNGAKGADHRMLMWAAAVVGAPECPFLGLSSPVIPKLWWEKSTLFKLLRLLWVQNARSFNESKAKNSAYPRHGDLNPSERWKSTNAEWLCALPVITKE